MFRVLTGQVLLLVKRIFHLSQIFHALVLEAVCHIPFQENLRMQIGGSLCRSSQAEPIHIIARHHRIDWTYIHLAWIARFHITFNQSLQTGHNVFEALDLCQVINEIVHIALRSGQLCLATIGRPKVIITHHGIDFLHLPSFLLENLGRHFFESVFRTSCNSPNHETSTEHIQFAKHIIGSLHPFAGRQSSEQLGNLHVLHKVHIRLFRKIQDTFLQAKRGISHDIKMSGKSEVLRIVGNESQVETFVLLHINRIHDVILIKGDTIVRNRTIKRVLEQAYTVFVHIHILENILQDRGHDISRIEQFVHTGRIDSLNNALLAFRMLAIHMLGNRFIHRHRKNMLVYFRTILHLVTEEREFLENLRFTERVGRNVIDRKSQFLIRVVAIVILLLQVIQFLMGYHFLHQLHCRIVLTGILSLFGFYHHFVKRMVQLFHEYGQILCL